MYIDWLSIKMSPDFASKIRGIKFRIVDLPEPLWPTKDVIFPPSNFKLIDCNVGPSFSSYEKFILLKLISAFFILRGFADFELLISFFWSMTGKILDAADKPWLIIILSVERDLTGW